MMSLKSREIESGTAEVESAFVSHKAVAETAVIGKPHPTAGEQIKAFVILKQGWTETPDVIQMLQDHVLQQLVNCRPTGNRDLALVA